MMNEPTLSVYDINDITIEVILDIPEGSRNYKTEDVMTDIIVRFPEFMNCEDVSLGSILPNLLPQVQEIYFGNINDPCLGCELKLYGKVVYKYRKV